MIQPTATILLVEHDENDNYFTERAFRKIGVQNPIQIVESGNEAIAYMKGEGKYADRERFPYPAIIISDLQMKDGNGFDVLYHLKSHPEWAIIPAVILTFSSDQDDIQMAYLLGASSYHVKVTNPAAMEKLLSGMWNYWMSCEVPDVDKAGKQVPTKTAGKMGERYRALMRDTLRKDLTNKKS